MKRHEIVTVYRNGTDVPSVPLECPVIHRGYTAMFVTCATKKEMDEVFKKAVEIICPPHSTK